MNSDLVSARIDKVTVDYLSLVRRKIERGCQRKRYLNEINQRDPQNAKVLFESGSSLRKFGGFLVLLS